VEVRAQGAEPPPAEVVVEEAREAEAQVEGQEEGSRAMGLWTPWPREAR